MTNGEEYKRRIMKKLACGNTESIPVSANSEQNYQNFDDIAQRSSPHEQRQLFGDSLHPNQVPPSEMEPELEKAIAQIKSSERHDVAREFLKQLKGKGISDRDLEKQLSLSTRHANQMNANEVCQLAAFTYHNYPEIFQNVIAEKPAIVKFLSNPLMGAILGTIAAKWLGNRRYS